MGLRDLIVRPPSELERDLIRRFVTEKRILVTGAGGSIGAELVRQISDLKPSRLFLLDNSELNLFAIDRELAERHSRMSRRDVFCDVRDAHSISHWFAELRPDIVFHAAALKHVPLVETHPVEGVRTNVGGTQVVADACVKHGVGTMVLVSTDKAVNPHNVMGATKRIAEAYCQALDLEDRTTRFLCVRFGNVLGSSGSVVPLFQRQIATGGPVTVTHPDITRYFMTIPEAVQLLLQASMLGARPEARRGAIYVLDMGKPIKIADLARRMIHVAGRSPFGDIRIEYIGLRPGEKLHEELVHQHEELSGTSADGVMMVSPRTSSFSILRNQIVELTRAADGFDEERLLRLLKVIVPEYENRVERTMEKFNPA